MFVTGKRTSPSEVASFLLFHLACLIFAKSLLYHWDCIHTKSGVVTISLRLVWRCGKLRDEILT